MVRSKLLKSKIKSETATLLGIQDPTPSSKITGLIEALVNDLDNFEQNELTTLDNMYTDTCDSTYLDKIGSIEGLSRSRTNHFKFGSGLRIFSISSNRVVTLERGKAYELDEDLTFVLDNDIVINNIDENYFVGGEIKIKTRLNSLNVLEDSIFKLIDGVYLTIHEPLNIPVIEEDENDFRLRVLFSQSTSKFGSENAIRSCIAISNLVTSYRIDYSTNPITIYIFNKNAFIDENTLTEVLLYSKNIIETELNKKKADGTSYIITTPNKNNFKIVFESRVDQPRNIPNDMYEFINTIADTYILGLEYTYNLETIKTFLSNRFIDLSFLEDYNVQFKKTFINFDLATENNEIVIYKNEYPFLDSIEIT